MSSCASRSRRRAKPARSRKPAGARVPQATHKGRIDLVTRFDHESEALLRERLTAATPIPVVGEEHGGQRASGAHEATWYVDPIDGTTNFVHGHPFWCVSVGLYTGEAPLLGAVVAPSLGVEWTGDRRARGDCAAGRPAP